MDLASECSEQILKALAANLPNYALANLLVGLAVLAGVFAPGQVQRVIAPAALSGLVLQASSSP